MKIKVLLALTAVTVIFSISIASADVIQQIPCIEDPPIVEDSRLIVSLLTRETIIPGDEIPVNVIISPLKTPLYIDYVEIKLIKDSISAYEKSYSVKKSIEGPISLSALLSHHLTVDTDGFDAGHYQLKVTVWTDKGFASSKPKEGAITIKSSPNIVFNIPVVSIEKVNGKFYPVVGDDAFVKNVGNLAISADLKFVIYKIGTEEEGIWSQDNWIKKAELTRSSWKNLKLGKNEEYRFSAELNEELEKIRLDEPGYYIIEGIFDDYSSKNNFPKILFREYITPSGKALKEYIPIEYHLVALGYGSYLKAGVFGSNITGNVSIDVCLIIDTTGSMWDEIDVVKQKANQLVGDIANMFPDYRIALIDFRDHPIYPMGGSGDYPAKLDLNFTSDRTAIINAINSLSIGWGADWPESQSDALHMALNDLTWRDYAYKMIILITDAPPHDPSIDGKSCPAGYDYKSETYSARDKGIHISVIGCSGIGYYDADDVYRWVASETGGTFVYLGNVEELIEKIGEIALTTFDVIGTGVNVHITFSDLLKEATIKSETLPSEANIVGKVLEWKIPTIKTEEEYEIVIEGKYEISLEFAESEVDYTNAYGQKLKLYSLDLLSYSSKLIESGEAEYKDVYGIVKTIRNGDPEWPSHPYDVLIERAYETDYMVVVAPLLAQAFVAEENRNQNAIDEKKEDIKRAIKAVLQAHPKAYIYFTDKDLKYAKNTQQLRKDVYGLPFMPWLGTSDAPIKTYGEIRGKEYTEKIWIKYRDIILKEIKRIKPTYVLILGSPHEFPEYVSNEVEFIYPFGTNVFSDLYYVGDNIVSSSELIHIGEEKIYASVGRISIEFADDYFGKSKTFEKRALIHSMHTTYKYPPLIPRIPSHFIVDELDAPVIKKLTGRDVDFCTILDFGFCEVPQPRIGEIITGHVEGEKQNGGTYYVDYAIADEKHPNNINMNLEGYSLVVVGWHGDTWNICSKEADVIPINIRPCIFTGIPCLISNEGDYIGTSISYPEQTFPHYLLPHGATLIGNTMYGAVFLPGMSASPGVVVTFIDQLIQSKTIGDAWLKTVKKMVGPVSARTTIYARNEFRLLGDPALDIAALDDPGSDNIQSLPSEVIMSLSLFYNRTIFDNLTVVNATITSINVNPPISFSAYTSYFSNMTGAPIVPVVYIEVPMPLNQTISKIEVSLSNSEKLENLGLSRGTIYLLTPNGTVPVPGYIFKGIYPNLNYTFVIVSDHKSKLLKIAIYPLQYDTTTNSAIAYRNAKVTIYSESIVEEPVYAKLHLEALPPSFSLREDEERTIYLHLYNDPEATTDALNITLTCTLPAGVNIVSSDGKIVDNTITWKIERLNSSGVNASRLLKFTVKASPTITTTITNITIIASYSDASNYVYPPIKLEIPAKLISPKHADLELIDVRAPSIAKVGSTINITAIIQNTGELGLVEIPIALFINESKIGESVIQEILPGKIVSINFSYTIPTTLPSGELLGMVKIEPLALETEFDDNAKVFDLTIENLPPIANTNGPYMEIEGQSVEFNASLSYDPEGVPLTYYWNFGDGETAATTQPTITHIYAQEGNYTVTLIVNDSVQNSTPSITYALINDTEPIAEFTGNQTSGFAPLTVQFNDSSVSYDGITAWEWDFDGDGRIDSNEQNPTYTYDEAGTYTVSLTVHESDGDSDTETREDYITVTSAADTEPPTIESVTLDIYINIPNSSFHVTVEATDNVGVTSVTADGVTLTETGSTWEGDIFIPEGTPEGEYTLTIRLRMRQEIRQNPVLITQWCSRREVLLLQ